MHIREKRYWSGRQQESAATPQNQSPRESMAVISGSDSTNAICTPESGSTVESSLPEDSSPPCDAAMDNRSDSGASRETRGPSENRPGESPEHSRVASLKRGAWSTDKQSADLFHTHTLRSPWPPAEVAPHVESVRSGCG
jgi:hypothetical protein